MSTEALLLHEGLSHLSALELPTASHGEQDGGRYLLLPREAKWLSGVAWYIHSSDRTGVRLQRKTHSLHSPELGAHLEALPLTALSSPVSRWRRLKRGIEEERELALSQPPKAGLFPCATRGN